MWVLGILSAVILLCQYDLTNAIVVELNNGKVEGITRTTLARTTYHSFLAMRYAKPPTGDLRFELPQALESWNDTYNATFEKNICYQAYSNNPLENEDCLYINVHTPKDLTKNVTGDLAVMVYIHGGAFIASSGYEGHGGVGPKFFMDFNVILVSFNFRIGPFGFLSTEDSILPGNLGLKDQVFALQWVQDNIARFGGNKEKVTIFGSSSGAGAVSYHLLNPKTKGLYAGGIQMSGSAIAPWAYQRFAKTIAYLTAGFVDSTITNSTSSSDLKTALKKANASAIDSASVKLFLSRESAFIQQISQGIFYAPVIETESDHSVISDNMYELFEAGKYNDVPVLIGINNNEGLWNVDKPSQLAYFATNEDKPETLVPFDMHIDDDDTKVIVGTLIKFFYSLGANFSENILYGVNYHGFNDFQRGPIKQADLQAQNNAKVYLYNFNYSGKMGNNVKETLRGTRNVTHDEDSNYFFSRSFNSQIPDNTNLSQFSAADVLTHNRIMTIFTNFAKQQNPTPQKESVLGNITWSTFDSGYLEIGKTLKLIGNGIYPKDLDFKIWDVIYALYGVRPFDTY